jgi:D-beta-D-heptose 7-phosphate kinase / D-beta-D-heptose 1-phosphate adenosyltransferase
VIPQVKAIIVSDYGKGFLTRNLLKCLLDLAKKEGIPVLVDPKGMNYARYRGATYITPNLREASLASGVEIRNQDSLLKAGNIILDQCGVEGVIITRGKDGSTLVTREKREDFTVKPVEIVDVTGAGDTVIATLALAIANGLSVENSITLANLAASIVVSRFGAASVTVEEMLSSLRENSLDRKRVAMEDIAFVLRNHRIKSHKISFTNGCFDLFHAGHLEVLRKASELGDVLVVGINSDKSVARIKGQGRPIIPEDERVALVSAMQFVDYAVVFDEDTPLKLIEQVQPDVLVKGEDWKGKPVVGENVVTARGGKVQYVKLLSGISTTNLIDKIRSGLSLQEDG